MCRDAGGIMAQSSAGGEAAASAEETLRRSLEHYVQAWNEPDDDARRQHLAAAWTENATYTDPSADVRGREALVRHIAGFLADPELQGFSIVRVTDVDVHHRSFRFGWEMQGPDGQTVTPGIDYGEFNDEGMITKIVGFFGPMAALP